MMESGNGAMEASNIADSSMAMAADDSIACNGTVNVTNIYITLPDDAMDASDADRRPRITFKLSFPIHVDR
jgi:hypothetical protein